MGSSRPDKKKGVVRGNTPGMVRPSLADEMTDMCKGRCGYIVVPTCGYQFEIGLVEACGGAE